MGNAGIVMTLIMLIRDSTEAGTAPGKIIGYHRSTRYDTPIGQTTAFNNVGYSFVGDSQLGQEPEVASLLFTSMLLMRDPEGC